MRSALRMGLEPGGVQAGGGRDQFLHAETITPRSCTVPEPAFGLTVRGQPHSSRHGRAPRGMIVQPTARWDSIATPLSQPSDASRWW